MKGLELLIRGLLAGLIIAAPVGPVNVLCVQRTIEKSWRSGLFSGLGAAAADTIYGAIAGFSISFVIQFLLRQQSHIRFFGGILLILLGLWYWFRRPNSIHSRKHVENGTADSASTFFLTLTNPTTVLSFLAVLAVLGLAAARPWYLTLLVVLGIFCGSMLWWIVLTGTANRLRHRFTGNAVVWMNRIGGLTIGAFGLISLLLSRG